MTTSEPIPRLQLLACAYELIAGDLLVDEDDGSTRRVASQTGAKTVTVTFDDATTQDFPRRAFLTVYRDQSALLEAFQGLPPTIVA